MSEGSAGEDPWRTSGNRSTGKRIGIQGKSIKWNTEDAKKKVGSNYEVSRYKGLGEMSDKQLKFTTMDKEHRMLLQVDINDFNVVERKIDVLMGSDSKKRKEWLEEAVDFSEQDTFIEEMK